MAEWLRRWTRNPMGTSRAGSNPVRSEFLLSHCIFSSMENPFRGENVLIDHRILSYSLKSGNYKTKIVCPYPIKKYK